MQVFLSTVVRQNPVEDGGELICLDWAAKTITARVPLFPASPTIQDPNSNGNSRGGRGIVRHKDTLYVALYHSVYVFDLQLKLQSVLTHNLFVALHELFLDADQLWLASTAIDAAICINLQGHLQQSWWAREEPLLQEHLDLTPVDIDKTTDNRLKWLAVKNSKDPSHTHLNAVAIYDGDLFVLLNRFGIVYNVSKQKILIEDKKISGCHNLVFHAGYLLINDSRRSRLMIYDTQGALKTEIDLIEFPEINRIYKTVMGVTSKKRAIFARGLSPISDDRVLVGFSPASVAEINIQTGELLDLFQYSDNAAVCVHGLLACP